MAPIHSRRRIAALPRLDMLALAVATVIAMLAALAAPLSAQGAPPARRDYTQADVDFVRDMILHHAQAVVMSDWAATHGARPDVGLLARRIALSQRDEITLMQRWLADRGVPVPDPLHMRDHMRDSTRDHTPGPPRDSVRDTSPMHMPGMDMGQHPMLMAGMLTPEEMRQLDAARGPAFDRLYLTGMIKHHQGALAMVAHLFATPGAAQQPELSSLVTDIDASQRVEIARMEAMLNTLNARQPQ